MLKTAFWKNAAASLPVSVRDRYMVDIEYAERLELAIDGLLELVARVKAALTRSPAPRSAHSH